MSKKTTNTVAGVLGVILTIPIIMIVFTVAMLGVGLFGYAIGWGMELIASPIIYSALDVIPTQPFSKGDFPKLVAIIATIGGIPSLLSLRGLITDDK